ncbi:hypothetical protein CDD83_10803 [Cordyceps sp. RAO-2017]|nr:hypothetical protein CDD83_10803 [Cordyceps sp. RAO-2017]
MGGGGGAGDPPSSRANPFSSASSNPFTTTTANPFASAPAGPSPSPPQQRAPSPSLSKTFAESLRLDSAPAPAAATPEPWPATPAPKPFPTAYLSEADYETLDPTPAMVPAHARLEDAAETSALDREAFESAMDATFQRFADRLAQNPDQVIRYEFAGAPLLYSKTDPVGQRLADGPGPPACPACRARRAFEVQLTPNAIAELEAGDEPDLEGMEWGTVIVAVCERDCVPARAPKGHVAYFEEWAGVQWEELTKQK